VNIKHIALFLFFAAAHITYATDVQEFDKKLQNKQTYDEYINNIDEKHYHNITATCKSAINNRKREITHTPSSSAISRILKRFKCYLQNMHLFISKTLFLSH
jgi:hypothetical protein